MGRDRWLNSAVNIICYLQGREHHERAEARETTWGHEPTLSSIALHKEGRPGGRPTSSERMEYFGDPGKDGERLALAAVKSPGLKQPLLLLQTHSSQGRSLDPSGRPSQGSLRDPLTLPIYTSPWRSLSQGLWGRPISISVALKGQQAHSLFS